MGYFGRIQKCARYYDSDAGEYRWGAWKYTGSASAGADYVSNDGLAVVYRVQVNYGSGDTGIGAFAVSTNFVNPNSSGNPSEAYCYLYTFDPTDGGSAETAAAPLGSEAFAGPVSFEASNVGNYLSFSFPALTGKPAMLYFWFSSSVTYTGYGSNQIYHYATGNWNKTWQTGTKTPALTGGFSDTGGSGGETGSGYMLIASGSYSGVYAQQSFDMTRRERTASYTAVSFSGGGSVSFTAARKTGEDSGLRMDGYLTAGTGFDTVNGMPAGTVLARSEGGASFGFDFRAEPGVTYYLWTVIHSAGYIESEITVSITPTSWCYTAVDKGASLNIAQSSRSFSMSMGTYQVGRMKLSFAYSAQADITVSSADSGGLSRLWFSDSPNIDSATGRPMNVDQEFSADGSQSLIKLEKGKIYYVFALFSAGTATGTVSFSIVPPSVVWTVGDSAEYMLIDSAVSREVSLGEAKYSVLKLSFAHPGTAQFYTSGSVIDDYQCIRAYLSTHDSLDNHYGTMDGYIATAAGGTEPYESPDYSISCSVEAGRTYYLITRNWASSAPRTTAFSTVIHIVPPVAPSGGYTLIETAEDAGITGSRQYKTEFSRYSISRRKLSFRYRGEAEFSAAASEDSDGIPQLRGCISDSAEIDLDTGVPEGTILAQSGAEGESFSLTYAVEDRNDYYLWVIASEIYCGGTGKAGVSITCPAERRFAITERAEYYGITEETVHSASPGESGVCLLELSFAASGLVYFSTSDTAGNMDRLRGWLGLAPYLDGASGMPCSDVLAEASGGKENRDYSFSLPVEAGTTYYLFSRDDWLYGSPGFDIHIKPVPGVMRIAAGGEEKGAVPYIYRQGAWHAAVPMCRTGGAWRTGG